jgi:hypothetical protein
MSSPNHQTKNPSKFISFPEKQKHEALQSIIFNTNMKLDYPIIIIFFTGLGENNNRSLWVSETVTWKAGRKNEVEKHLGQQVG